MTPRQRPARTRQAQQPGEPTADTQARQTAPAAGPGRTRRDLGGGSPDYVADVWVSDQLRAKHARTDVSLWQALAVGRQPAPGAEQWPDPEPEAEP